MRSPILTDALNNPRSGGRVFEARWLDVKPAGLRTHRRFFCVPLILTLSKNGHIGKRIFLYFHDFDLRIIAFLGSDVRSEPFRSLTMHPLPYHTVKHPCGPYFKTLSSGFDRV